MEDCPAVYDEDGLFDTSIIPWWAWVRRFHLPEAEKINGGGSSIHPLYPPVRPLYTPYTALYAPYTTPIHPLFPLCTPYPTQRPPTRPPSVRGDYCHLTRQLT